MDRYTEKPSQEASEPEMACTVVYGCKVPLLVTEQDWGVASSLMGGSQVPASPGRKEVLAHVVPACLLPCKLRKL